MTVMTTRHKMSALPVSFALSLALSLAVLMALSWALPWALHTQVSVVLLQGKEMASVPNTATMATIPVGMLRWQGKCSAMWIKKIRCVGQRRYSAITSWQNGWRALMKKVQQMADIMLVPVVLDVPRRGEDLRRTISTGMLQSASSYATSTGTPTRGQFTCSSCRKMAGF